MSRTTGGNQLFEKPPPVHKRRRRRNKKAVKTQGSDKKQRPVKSIPASSEWKDSESSLSGGGDILKKPIEKLQVEDDKTESFLPPPSESKENVPFKTSGALAASNQESNTEQKLGTEGNSCKKMLLDDDVWLKTRRFDESKHTADILNVPENLPGIKSSRTKYRTMGKENIKSKKEDESKNMSKTVLLGISASSKPKAKKKENGSQTVSMLTKEPLGTPRLLWAKMEKELSSENKPSSSSRHSKMREPKFKRVTGKQLETNPKLKVVLRSSEMLKTKNLVTTSKVVIDEDKKSKDVQVLANGISFTKSATSKSNQQSLNTAINFKSDIQSQRSKPLLKKPEDLKRINIPKSKTSGEIAKANLMQDKNNSIPMIGDASVIIPAHLEQKFEVNRSKGEEYKKQQFVNSSVNECGRAQTSVETEQKEEKLESPSVKAIVKTNEQDESLELPSKAKENKDSKNTSPFLWDAKVILKTTKQRKKKKKKKKPNGQGTANLWGKTLKLKKPKVGRVRRLTGLGKEEMQEEFDASVTATVEEESEGDDHSVISVSMSESIQLPAENKPAPSDIRHSSKVPKTAFIVIDNQNEQKELVMSHTKKFVSQNSQNPQKEEGSKVSKAHLNTPVETSTKMPLEATLLVPREAVPVSAAGHISSNDQRIGVQSDYSTAPVRDNDGENEENTVELSDSSSSNVNSIVSQGSRKGLKKGSDDDESKSGKDVISKPAWSNDVMDKKIFWKPKRKVKPREVNKPDPSKPAWAADFMHKSLRKKPPAWLSNQELSSTIISCPDLKLGERVAFVKPKQRNAAVKPRWETDLAKLLKKQQKKITHNEESKESKWDKAAQRSIDGSCSDTPSNHENEKLNKDVPDELSKDEAISHLATPPSQSIQKNQELVRPVEKPKTARKSRKLPVALRKDMSKPKHRKQRSRGLPKVHRRGKSSEGRPSPPNPPRKSYPQIVRSKSGRLAPKPPERRSACLHSPERKRALAQDLTPRSASWNPQESMLKSSNNFQSERPSPPNVLPPIGSPPPKRKPISVHEWLLSDRYLKQRQRPKSHPARTSRESKILVRDLLSFTYYIAGLFSTLDEKQWKAEEQKWNTRRLEYKAKKSQSKPQMDLLKEPGPITDLAKSLSSDFSSNLGSFPQSNSSFPPSNSSSVLKGDQT